MVLVLTVVGLSSSPLPQRTEAIAVAENCDVKTKIMSKASLGNLHLFVTIDSNGRKNPSDGTHSRRPHTTGSQIYVVFEKNIIHSLLPCVARREPHVDTGWLYPLAIQQIPDPDPLRARARHPGSKPPAFHVPLLSTASIVQITHEANHGSGVVQQHSRAAHWSCRVLPRAHPIPASASPRGVSEAEGAPPSAAAALGCGAAAVKKLNLSVVDSNVFDGWHLGRTAVTTGV